MVQAELTGRVVVDALNLRASPGGAVLRVLPRNAELRILNRFGAWLQVTAGGDAGFVSSQFVRISPPAVPAAKAAPAATRTGTVDADMLNLRQTPGGTIISQLARGTPVSVTGEEDGWLRVDTGGLAGYVKREYIRLQEPVSLPPPEKQTAPAAFKLVGDEAIGPDGKRFAKRYKAGLVNYGTTSIDSFVNAHPERFAGLAGSLPRVIRAVSANEGKYEAINSWDNAFLSFGIFQWTSGTGSDPGELPAVLERLHEAYPQTFTQYFGQHGLAVARVTAKAGFAPVGYFSLNGVLLASPEAKSVLRGLPWAYRFWSAGHDDNVREVQTRHALERIGLFYRNNCRKVRGLYVGDYICSEYGVALLLDQHVNRPGHVPLTLAKAVEALAGEIDIEHPDAWGDEQEAKLLDTYLGLRHATSMTNSESRARSILDRVEDGTISNRRRSFLS